jgi:hypothetical protein
VQWIMEVLSSYLLLGYRVAEGGQSRGGRQYQWNFNGTGCERWKRGRGGDRVLPFLEGKRGRR